MYGETKSNARSFRYSDKVAKALESAEGSSLNAKFESLVLYCYEKVPDRKKELDRINADIQKKREEYRKLCDQLKDVSELIRTLETLQQYGAIAARKAEMVAKDLNVESTSKKAKAS